MNCWLRQRILVESTHQDVGIDKQELISIDKEIEMKLAKHPPNKVLQLADLPRAGLEMSLLPWTLPWLLSAKKGDGSPALMIPGFMGDESSFSIMKLYLNHLGYKAFTWGQGRNLGFRRGRLYRTITRIEELQQQFGQAVNLIGQSLGGVFAREIAKRRPDLIQQVITLGSPFGDPHGTTSTATQLYKTINPDIPESHLSEEEVAMKDRFVEAPPVPQTAIYSRSDGHTHWTGCVQMVAKDAPAENIEVYGSHIGMSVNGLVFYVIADRLALQQDYWKPFDRTGWRAMYYPEPVQVKGIAA